jgi:RNA-directed DNA polymerase
MSYGLRTGRGAKCAQKEVNRCFEEVYTHVVEADIEGYFDKIPHDQIMRRVEESISDGRILDLPRSWLNRDTLEGGQEKQTGFRYPARSAVTSPHFANICLHPLDCLMTGSGYEMARYADYTEV